MCPWSAARNNKAVSLQLKEVIAVSVCLPFMAHLAMRTEQHGGAVPLRQAGKGRYDTGTIAALGQGAEWHNSVVVLSDRFS
jgi:hypothetical protein